MSIPTHQLRDDCPPGSAGDTAHLSADGCLERYLKEIAQVPPLAVAEERRLARRAARGDLDARRRLISANLRLVVTMAARYAHHGIPLCDLIQEGSLGLIKAAERYDWHRGTRFGTYAAYWIHEHIVKALTAETHALHLTGHAFRQFRRIRKEADRLTTALQREPTISEIAAAADLSTAEVAGFLSAASFPLSLDDPLPDRPEMARIEEIACEYGCDPGQQRLTDVTRSQIERAIDDALTPRERWVIVRSFGLNGETPWKLKKMAAELSLSLARVRQIRSHALRKLRQHLKPRTPEVE